MSFEEAELLRERAEEFLKTAKLLMDNRLYDIAVFSLEQYVQLMLKYRLLLATGSYPRTHSLTRLVELLATVNPSLRVLLDNDEYLLLLTKLEDAYIGARHLPRKYTEREARKLYSFTLEVLKPLVERV